MFTKSWVFDRGGRPVFYQPDTDFDILPEELRWRHVRFEPTSEPVIDFTWEREWRVRCDELSFLPAEAVIVVPNGQWVDALRRSHRARQDLRVELYAIVMEREIAEMWREPFRWHVVASSDSTYAVVKQAGPGLGLEEFYFTRTSGVTQVFWISRSSWF